MFPHRKVHKLNIILPSINQLKLLLPKRGSTFQATTLRKYSARCFHIPLDSLWRRTSSFHSTMTVFTGPSMEAVMNSPAKGKRTAKERLWGRPFRNFFKRCEMADPTSWNEKGNLCHTNSHTWHVHRGTAFHLVSSRIGQKFVTWFQWRVKV